MANPTERRARDVDWFKARSYPTGKHGSGRPSCRAYGNPWAYLIALVALPASITLAAVTGWPKWAYGPLIFASGVPGWNMVRSWAEDQKFPANSARGAFGQLWLYFGAALPQAIRALREPHRSAK